MLLSLAAVIHPKTVFETLKNATKPESKEVSLLQKHSHHPRHQKCAAVFQDGNSSLGRANSSARVGKNKEIRHGNSGRATGVVASEGAARASERASRSPAAAGSL